MRTWTDEDPAAVVGHPGAGVGVGAVEHVVLVPACEFGKAARPPIAAVADVLAEDRQQPGRRLKARVAETAVTGQVRPTCAFVDQLTVGDHRPTPWAARSLFNAMNASSCAGVPKQAGQVHDRSHEDRRQQPAQAGRRLRDAGFHRPEAVTWAFRNISDAA